MNIKHRVLWSTTALVGAGAVMTTAATLTAAALWHGQMPGGLDLMGGKIYGPFSTFGWLPMMPMPWPGEFLAGVAVSLIAAIASISITCRLMIAGAFGTLLSNFRKARQKKFGEDHWGTLQDAIEAGFIMGKGKAPPESKAIRVLGELFGHIFTVTDSRYIICFGPTGAGKTYSVMVPFGLSFAGSAVFYSAGKEDIIKATSGYRSTFSDVMVLDLGNPSGWRKNPLSEVRKGTEYEYDDCMLIASLFPPKSAAESNVPVYPLESAKLLAATFQHVINDPKMPSTIGESRRFMNQTPKAYFEAMLKSPIRTSREAMAQVLSLAGVTRDNVIAAARGYLDPWASEIIDRVTSESDFSMADIVCGPRPVTLYLRIPDNMREHWRPVLNVLIAQFFKSLMHHRDVMPDGRRKIHHVAAAIDELHMFKFAAFNNDLAVLRDYGFYGMFCTQSPKSLEESYGRTQTILENDRIQLYMATGDKDTAQMISTMIGTATDVRTTRSRSRLPGAWIASSSLSQSEHTRPAMDEGAIRSLPNDKMILLPTGNRPFIIDKINYQTHPAFHGRKLDPKVPLPPRHDEKPKRVRVRDLVSEL